tara:strand:+ start:3312 stop:3569 length:258 start_codon:yes stop_codon:yes gene_type:complete
MGVVCTDMKINGCMKGSENLSELDSITIASDPGTLRKVADFILQCAKEIEEDPDGWEHEHLGDYLGNEEILLNSDIVIWNSKDGG